MGRPASGHPPDSSSPTLIAPSLSEWAALSAAERERFVLKVLDALSDPASAMAEGRPHKKAKSRALDELSLHFSKIGRTIYLADELSVIYPAREPFVPDLLAALDVPQPEDDERMAWVVADEGRGPDLIIEVLHRGNRDKDLDRNVELYADLGIQEYFVYDRLNFKIHGFRLPSPGAKKYRTLQPRLGRHDSQVLGLDLAVVDRRLRFFSGFAELVGSAELISRLSSMMDDTEARVAELEAEAAARESQEAGLQAQVQDARQALRRSILLVLQVRQVPLSSEVNEQIQSCQDPALLQRFLERAATCKGDGELLAP